DPPRATRHPFEMLDGVRHIGPASVDTRRPHAAVEQFAGRSDKGVTGQILGIARLLADKHDLGPFRPLAEHGLRRIAEQRASGAFGRRVAYVIEARLLGDQRCGGGGIGVFGFGPRSATPLQEIQRLLGTVPKTDWRSGRIWPLSRCEWC